MSVTIKVLLLVACALIAGCIEIRGYRGTDPGDGGADAGDAGGDAISDGSDPDGPPAGAIDVVVTTPDGLGSSDQTCRAVFVDSDTQIIDTMIDGRLRGTSFEGGNVFVECESGLFGFIDAAPGDTLRIGAPNVFFTGPLLTVKLPPPATSEYVSATPCASPTVSSGVTLESTRDLACAPTLDVMVLQRVVGGPVTHYFRQDDVPIGDAIVDLSSETPTELERRSLTVQYTSAVSEIAIEMHAHSDGRRMGGTLRVETTSGMSPLNWSQDYAPGPDAESQIAIRMDMLSNVCNGLPCRSLLRQRLVLMAGSTPVSVDPDTLAPNVVGSSYGNNRTVSWMETGTGIAQIAIVDVNEDTTKPSRWFVPRNKAMQQFMLPQLPPELAAWEPATGTTTTRVRLARTDVDDATVRAFVGIASYNAGSDIPRNDFMVVPGVTRAVVSGLPTP